MYSTRRVEMMAAVALLTLLIVGTVLVLRPFIISLILAAVLAYASWPVYEWLLARLRERSGAAATAMTLLLLLTLVTPFGPLGLDYAYGFDKRPPGWQLHFKFGQGF